MSTNLKSFFVPNYQLADDLLIAACKNLSFDPNQVFADIKKDQMQKTIIKHVFSLTEKPEEHSKLAGAIAMWKQYRNSPSTIEGYLNLFRTYLRDDVVKFMETHHEILQKELNEGFKLDFNMTYFSVGTIIETYLARRKYDEDPSELPQFCYLRIAVGQFCSRQVTLSGENNLENVINAYRRYSSKQGTPASPTIFNMGFKDGSPSSCMIYTIEDSLDDILSIMKEAGIASKNNAGLGMDFSGLRHSNIGRHGVSQGIIPLLKIWDDLTRYINQGGRRPGALTCSTRVHHYDTPEFIHLVDKVGEDLTKATKINTSIMISDLFRKRCVEGGKWNLFCPKQTGNLNNLHGKEFEESYLKYEIKAATWNRYKKYKLLREFKETTELDVVKEKLFDELDIEFNKPIPEACEEYQQYLDIKERRLSEEHLFRVKDVPKKILDQYQKLKEVRNLLFAYNEDDVLYQPIKMFVELSGDVYWELDAIVNPPLSSEQREVQAKWEAEKEFFVTMCEKYEGIPQQVDAREFEADSIMDEICDMQIKSGMPYIIHGCNANRKNNMCNVGPVRSSNLCQEIMIPAVAKEQTGCCNLSSLALNSFVKDGQFDFLEFGSCTQSFVVALNQVIDETRNVSEKVTRSNNLNRPIGIGVNGFADMCHLMNIPTVDVSKLPKKVGVDEDGEEIYKFVDLNHEAPDYDEEALKERVLNPVLDDLNWKIWSCMYFNALWKSMEEAKIYGPYVNFWTSPTAKGKLQYHLWQDEAKEIGREYPFKLYPAEPSEWGDKSSPSWTTLIENIMKYGLRNALLLTCMPTASSANVIGNCESTEFHMQNIYSRKVQSGDYPIVNFHMVKDLQEIKLWNEEIYNNIVSNGGSILHIPESKLNAEQIIKLRFLKEKYLTMWEIPQMLMIQLAAARQVFIDHSQSMNIYIAHPTKDLLKAIHNYTGEMGLKTGMYYLRSKAANQAMVIGKKQQTQKVSLSESRDTDMLKMIELAIKSKEIQKVQEMKTRDEIIESTLMSATRPQEVAMCKFGPDGECIGCGS
jgi:ribonucleotide reductase alpha subunit